MLSIESSFWGMYKTCACHGQYVVEILTDNKSHNHCTGATFVWCHLLLGVSHMGPTPLQSIGQAISGKFCDVLRLVHLLVYKLSC